MSSEGISHQNLMAASNVRPSIIRVIASTVSDISCFAKVNLKSYREWKIRRNRHATGMLEKTQF